MSDTMTIKGKRPEFYETPGVDYLMHMTMVLAQELSATRDRLDTLERVLAADSGISRDRLEAYEPTQAALEDRERNRQEFFSMFFSVMAQESAQIKANDTTERFNQVIDDLATN